MSLPGLDRVWLEWSGFLDSQARSLDRRQLGFGCLAWNGRFALRPGTRLLRHSPQFHFLGHSRNRVAHLLDEGLQIIRPDAEPLGPGANLCRIGHVNLVANGRMFDALHGVPPGWEVNGRPGTS